MYAVTQEVCAAYGMPAYEVSNHARPGAESRHNLVYWRMGDYVGIGPGAHGRVTLDGQRWATVAPKAPGAWLTMVEAGRAGEEPREVVLPEEQATEYLLMSLRLSEGADMARYEALAGAALDAGKLTDLEALGLIAVDQGRLCAMPAGRAVLNGVLRELLA